MIKAFDFENASEYDKSNNVKIENGKATLIRNADLMSDLDYFMPFYDSINSLDKGTGTIIYNKASIDLYFLKFLNETLARWELNAPFIKKGTFRINFRVDNLNEPINFIFTFTRGVQQFYIAYYKASNNFRVFLRDKNNITAINVYIIYPLQTGQEYQLEVSADFTTTNNNKIYFFINGQKLYQNLSFTGEFDYFDNLIVGNYVGYSFKPEFAFRNLLFWNIIKHTDNYAYSSEFLLTRYSEGYLNTIEKIQTDKIEFININAVSCNFLLDKDNKKYYWNGTDWVEGEVYIGQDTLINNISKFNDKLKDGGLVKFFARINTNNWDFIGELDLIEVIYDYWGGKVGAPSLSVVYGNIFDIDGTKKKRTFYLYFFDDYFNIDKIYWQNRQIKVETDKSGYFEVNLLKNKKYVLKLNDKVYLLKTNNKDADRINNLIVNT